MQATKADLEAEREREIANQGKSSRPAIVKQFAALTLAKFLPATRDLIVDADANVWVQHFPRATSSTVPWTVFSAAGACSHGDAAVGTAGVRDWPRLHPGAIYRSGCGRAGSARVSVNEAVMKQ